MLLRWGFALAAGSRSGSVGGCGSGVGGGGWPSGSGSRAGSGSRGAEPVEPRLLLLEMHAQSGELPLDLANRLLALVEPLSLGLGEGELLHGLALPLLGLRDGVGELLRAVGACGRGGRGRTPPTLPAGNVEAQLLELLLARGDALRVLAQRPLHLLDLGERLLVAAPHVQPVAHSGSVSSIPAGGNHEPFSRGSRSRWYVVWKSLRLGSGTDRWSSVVTG